MNISFGKQVRKMSVVTGYSYSENANEIASEIAQKINNRPNTILFFSPVSVFEELTVKMREFFPESDIYGVTTNYSFFENRKCSTEYGPGTIAIAFGDSFKCVGGVIEEIILHPTEFAPAVKRSAELIPEKNTVCLSFTTAFYGSEELILDTLACAIGDKKIPVAGSSCGNEKWDRTTFVSHNGRVFCAASIYLFVHNKKGRITVLKQDMFVPMRTEFRATSVDVRKRMIYELDGKPAAMQLAKVLHYELYEMWDHLGEYGLGRMIGNEIYTTDFAGITKDKALEMFASVYGGSRLCLLERSKHNACLSDIIAAIRLNNPHPRFVLYINCMSLTKFYQEIKWLNVFSVGMGTLSPCYAGMSGYGEQLGRININKTLMAIAFE